MSQALVMDEAVRVVALVGCAAGGVLVDAGDYVPAGAAAEVHGQEIGQVGLGGHSRILSQIGVKWKVPGQIRSPVGSPGILGRRPGASGPQSVADPARSAFLVFGFAGTREVYGGAAARRQALSRRRVCSWGRRGWRGWARASR